MTFSSELRAFADKAERRVNDVFVRSTEEVHESVVNGSAVTGAPGQPVDTGNLRTSWVDEFTSPATWRTTTGVEYAPYTEDQVGGMTLRSEVGGFHSVKLTRGGWPRIVEQARREVVGD